MYMSSFVTIKRAITRNWKLLVAAVLVSVVAVSLYAYRTRSRRSRQHEGFFPLIFGAVTAGAALARLTGVDKKIQNVVGSKIGGGGGGGGPTYVGRQFDGYEWTCPDGTVDTAMDNSKACITSQFHPKVGDACPVGTTPATNGQCEVGYTGRVNDSGKWVCPFGTTDTGKSWENSSWHEAQKQCKRGGPYTRRIFADNKWVCPGGSKDTGLNWSNKEHGEKQCLWGR